MKSIELYGHGIGKVELVDSMGSDLTVVNSARVSFGKHKEDLEIIMEMYKDNRAESLHWTITMYNQHRDLLNKIIKEYSPDTIYCASCCITLP